MADQPFPVPTPRTKLHRPRVTPDLVCRERLHGLLDGALTMPLAPVSPLGALHKIRVAVVRDLWKEPDTILAPAERVSVETAISDIAVSETWMDGRRVFGG